MCPAPSLLPIPEIRSETFWSIMRERERDRDREREREFECPSCRDIRLNVSQAAEIIYSVGIMPHNIGTLDGWQDLRRRKELGQRTEAGREVGGQ